MRLRNLTPHAVALHLEDGTVLEVPPDSTGPARLAVHRAVVHMEVDGHVVPVAHVRFGEPEGLPDPEPDVLLIVSRIVLDALPWRGDLVAPDTSPEGAVRDAEGRIVGVRALARR